MLEREPQMSLSTSPPTTKKLEVIIPTLNEEMTIKETIENVSVHAKNYL